VARESARALALAEAALVLPEDHARLAAVAADVARAADAAGAACAPDAAGSG
jgi:hypothetical protein